MLKSPVELGECTEDLEQVEKCMLPECRKEHSHTRTHIGVKLLYSCVDTPTETVLHMCSS